MVGASVATRPMIGDTIGRFARGKIVKAEAKTVGIMPPPMKPCSARQTIISLIEDDGGAHQAHQREAAGGDREHAAGREHARRGSPTAGS